MNEKLAQKFVEAIKAFSEKPENLDNFELYLSHHFDVWLEKYANTPEDLVYEFERFAETKNLMKVRCISASVYVDKTRSDCTNNGISRRFAEILIEHPRGNEEVDLDNPPENFCVLRTLEFNGKPYYRLIPYYLDKNGKHSMFGGNFAYSSDSRFRELSEYPLPIHDRVE